MAQVTLQDIANKAGVSAVTVHRVLTGKGTSSPKTVEQVERIARELGYKGRKHKARLAQVDDEACFKTNSIGLLVMDKQHQILENTLNANLISHISSELAVYGLHLAIIHAPEEALLPSLISKDKIDGLILMGTPFSKRLLSLIDEISSVGMLSLAYGENYEIDWVTSDYQSRGRIAAEYFASRGHKRVVYVNTQGRHQGFCITGNSFRHCAMENGMAAEIFQSGEKLMHWEVSPEQDYLAMELQVGRMLSMPPAYKPTAMFVANDETAINLYKSLRRQGVEPMKDIDILACDNDNKFLTQLAPRPATMDLNLDVIAEHVVESLLFRIRNPKAVKGILTFIQPSVVLSPDCG